MLARRCRDLIWAPAHRGVPLPSLGHHAVLCSQEFTCAAEGCTVAQVDMCRLYQHIARLLSAQSRVQKIAVWCTALPYHALQYCNGGYLGGLSAVHFGSLHSVIYHCAVYGNGVVEVTAGVSLQGPH